MKLVLIFKKGELESWNMCVNYWSITLLSFPRKVYFMLLGKDEFLNFVFRRYNVESILAMGQWTRCSAMHNIWRDHGNLTIQSA